MTRDAGPPAGRPDVTGTVTVTPSRPRRRAGPTVTDSVTAPVTVTVPVTVMTRNQAAALAVPPVAPTGLQ